MSSQMPAKAGDKSRKRRTEADEDWLPEKRCFSNLTNFKSPKSRRKTLAPPTSNKQITNYFSRKSEPSVLMENEPKDSTKSQITDSQVLTRTPGKAFNVINCLKKVLEESTKDVAERLQLEITPPYLYDHKSFPVQKYIEFASSQCNFTAKMLLGEDRHLQFINFVRNRMCGQREFPDSFVIRGILELIMKTSAESQTMCTSTEQALADLHSLFTSIILTFPPSASYNQGQDGLHNYYLKMMTFPFKVFGVRVNSPERGIFHCVIDLLSELIFQTEEAVGKTLKQNDPHEQLNNFWLWDAKKNKKSAFVNFTREEKFERIFLVLDLLVQIMEDDMAMFIIKRSNKLQSTITNKKTCPLVCSILWKQHESLTILNPTIKNFINIFVSIIGLEYPQRIIQVISRLLNLVSHALNLYEYPDDIIEYPSYKNISMDLAREIEKTVENSVFFSTEFIVRTAKNIRSPLTQMLLVNQALENIHKVSKPISLEVPFNFIRNEEFTKHKNIPKESLPKNDQKFPFYDPKKMVESFEVTNWAYLELLRMYASAVTRYYRIQAVALEAKKIESKPETEVVPTESELFDFATFEEKLKDIDLTEKVKLRKIDTSFKKLVHIKLDKKICAFYINQIKYFWLLIKLIKTCHQKYGEKFEDWMKLVEEMETGI